jgi:hypothetical protein
VTRAPITPVTLMTLKTRRTDRSTRKFRSCGPIPIASARRNVSFQRVSGSAKNEDYFDDIPVRAVEAFPNPVADEPNAILGPAPNVPGYPAMVLEKDREVARLYVG